MKRARIAMTVAAFAAAAAFSPKLVLAQCTANGAPASCTQAGSISMIAGRVVRLQVSGSTTNLAAPTAADFDAGFNQTTGPTFTVSANAAWTLQLRASSGLWTATNTSPGAPARTNKPASDLKWSTSSGGPFVPLTTTDANLFTGPATASSATTLFFQTLYGWTLDTPGIYSLTLVLTLTSP
jgi:hypothetical protein